MRRLVVFGDSIARGDGSSNPKRSFVRRFCTANNIESTFFFCRGGATSAVGADWGNYVWCEPSPELVLVAYGMNDQTLVGRARRRPQVEPAQFRENIELLVRQLHGRWGQSDVMLVAPGLSHRTWVNSSGRTAEYRDQLLRVAQAHGCMVADVTARWERALENHSDDVLLENGMNHPSDLGHDVYFVEVLEKYGSRSVG